jgi:hypothetical protein
MKTSFSSLVLLVMLAPLAPGQVDLPVKIPDLPESRGSIRNPFSIAEITRITGATADGLVLELEDPSLNGTIFSGPYPFEAGIADYDYARYRSASPLRDGRGVIQIKRFLNSRFNANDWPQGQLDRFNPSMTIAYRLELEKLGFYNAVAGFRYEEGKFEKILTITEGPFVAKVVSDDPSRLSIFFETDEPAIGEVHVYPEGSLESCEVFSDDKESLRHEILVSGLEADAGYRYLVKARKADGETAVTRLYTLRTAPPRGSEGKTRFAFLSDSRQGYGGGERTYAGHNRRALSILAASAFRNGAEFFLVGGDLINGDTSSVEDFRLQLRTWKDTLSGFMRVHPVYTAMGNHERLVNAYQKDQERVWLDKFPYATDSAEAVFAEQFFNPVNGPEPSDPRRPPYRENVYHFQYGPTLVVAFNNNYWWSSDHHVPHYGGSPEGYMMDDQLCWIEEVLASAENDPTIRFIILFAQEPVFPCGGHREDAMWWSGDNSVRAFTCNDGEMTPSSQGIIEVRNRLWLAVSGSSKVAAVLAGDEHAYHRLLIDDQTPVGVPPGDDEDRDGVLDRYSPNPYFTHPTWQITAGTGGAPFYNRQETPWEPVYYDSQTGYCLFETEGDKISMSFHTITGQVTDRIDDLMAIKKR